LDCLLLSLLPNLEPHGLFPHQRSELGLVVEDIEVILNTSDDCVLAGNRDVSDADLAFVSSADLDAILRGVLDYHDALLLLACALKNQVVAVGLIHADHFLRILVPSTRHLDVPGKFSPADLTLELGEVVVLGAANHIFLDFYADPLG
jgi:hypothetical protein